ncbi:unnamed protein product [Blepharisma stoltei]|uniref:Uncharacterized protein n=1 Tax=Blepharisma stoltei TaxID=1481888 RepID=A0AAU9JA00_9CILI|nr:unnamed protein product [Blepharisma stoltei]
MNLGLPKLSFGLCLLLVCVLSKEEPEPINESEFHDEIAMSQTRTKWTACMSLAAAKLDQDAREIDTIASDNKVNRTLLEKKIVADIIGKCYDVLTWKQAENILFLEEIDLNRNDIKALVTLEKNSYKGDLSLSMSQKELIGMIAKDMHTTDDGFDFEPTYVPGYEETAKSSKSLSTYGGIIFSFVIIWVAVQAISFFTSKKADSDKPKTT